MKRHLMVRIVALCGSALALAGCFGSKGPPLWSPTSGEELPFSTGTYACDYTEPLDLTHHDELVRVERRTWGPHLYYQITTSSGTAPASFHRLIGNDYLMALQNDERMIIYHYVRLKEGTLHFIEPDTHTTDEIGRSYGIISLQGSVELEGVEFGFAKKFLIELGKNLDGASTTVVCGKM